MLPSFSLLVRPLKSRVLNGLTWCLWTRADKDSIGVSVCCSLICSITEKRQADIFCGCCRWRLTVTAVPSPQAGLSQQLLNRFYTHIRGPEVTDPPVTGGGMWWVHSLVPSRINRAPTSGAETWHQVRPARLQIHSKDSLQSFIELSGKVLQVALRHIYSIQTDQQSLKHCSTSVPLSCPFSRGRACMSECSDWLIRYLCHWRNKVISNAG